MTTDYASLSRNQLRDLAKQRNSKPSIHLRAPSHV